MRTKWKLLPLIFTLLIMTACTAVEATDEELDYEQTKKMVVDILKTDDGKKAIQEVMSDEKMQEMLVMDQKIVTSTIEKTLVSEEGTAFWKKAFEDPKFAETVAKSMQKEHENLLKGLMKDPQYRALMIEIMKDPELEKDLTTLLKSTEYRDHLQSVIAETFESPLFKAKIQAMLISAAEDIKKVETKKDDGGDSGDGGGS
jgi:spore germination protein D